MGWRITPESVAVKNGMGWRIERNMQSRLLFRIFIRTVFLEYLDLRNCVPFQYYNKFNDRPMKYFSYQTQKEVFLQAFGLLPTLTGSCT